MVTSVVQLVDNDNGYHLVRVLGRYCNSETEVKRLRDLCSRAASQHVERQYSPPAVVVPRLSKAQNEQIIALYQAGRRPVDIAREVGTSEWTVHHRLRRAGVVKRGGRIPAAHIDEAMRLHADGLSLTVIAKRVRHDPRTIQRALQERRVLPS